MKEVSVISVNYNGFPVTCEMIDSLHQIGFDGEIIVVDNGSRQNEAGLLSDKYPDIVAIRSEENLGFAGGNNLGIRKAKGRYLLLLNNDTTVTKGFLEPMIERLDSSPEIGVVCPKILFEYAPDTIQFAGYTPLHPITLRNHMVGFNQKDNGQFDKSASYPYAMGAAMLVKREVIDRAGEMPESYFLYYEELDWSQRIREAGYSIWYESRARIFHKESIATGKMSPLKQYYLTRNRLYFVKRNVRGLNVVFALFYQLFISTGKNCVMFLLQRRFDLFRATVRGVIHGMKMILGYDTKYN